jgi:septation ring formation regulator EzrA
MEIVSILVSVLVVIPAILIGYYFYVKAKLKHAIDKAVEESDKIREHCFDRIVEEVMKLVPKQLSKFFTEDFIKVLVGAAFDEIEELASHKIDN